MKLYRISWQTVKEEDERPSLNPQGVLANFTIFRMDTMSSGEVTFHGFRHTGGWWLEQDLGPLLKDRPPLNTLDEARAVVQELGAQRMGSDFRPAGFDASVAVHFEYWIVP